MKTFLDCIPCFVKQALKAGREAGADDFVLKEILDSTGEMIRNIPLENTPVETGGMIHSLVKEISGVNDPYRKIKRENIKEALSLLPELEMVIENSEDRLLTAVRIAIAGNVIDFGVDKDFNIKEDIKKILVQDFAVFDYDEFRSRAEKADKILYIGDNCGESVFDKLLIKELNKPVFYAVRGNPVLNDVTYSDAVDSGLLDTAEIISSGVSSPGTIIKNSNAEFVEIFNESDLVISKGQGNYEGLSGEKRDIFFLLKAKCHVISSHLNVCENSIILKGINI